MKKLLALAVVMSVVSVPAFALRNEKSPVNQRGEAARAEYAGYSFKRNSATDEMVVCSGRCVLRALLMSTGPLASAIKVRNTSVENGTGALVMVRQFSISNTNLASNNVPYPIILDKGISVTLTTVSSGEEVTVLYEDLD